MAMNILNTAAYLENKGPILFVGAHPDDLEFHAAGLAASLSQLGATVVYILMTSGEAGGKAKIREREQILSASAVGVHHVQFLRRKDGQLASDFQRGRLQKLMCEVIRHWKPQTIVTFCPANLCTSTWGIEHPDHRYGALATWEAIYPGARLTGSRSLKTPWKKPSAGHEVREILWFGDDLPEAYAANCYLPINAVWASVCQALSLHQSQHEAAEFISKAKVRAQRVGNRWQVGGLVEEFHRIVMPTF